MGRSPRPQGKGKPGHSASQTCLPGIWTSQGAASRRGAPPSEVGTQKTGLSPIRVIGSTLLPQKPRLRISPSKKITLRIQPPVPPPSDPGAQEPRSPGPQPLLPQLQETGHTFLSVSDPGVTVLSFFPPRPQELEIPAPPPSRFPV